MGGVRGQRGRDVRKRRRAREALDDDGGGGAAWGRYLVSNGGLRLNNSSLELRRRILAVCVCVCYRSIYTTHCVYAESTMER